MIKIQIDGIFYEVKPDKNLLETCLSLGFDIPYFCYHPALGSVGACRLCAVKKFRNESDTKGQIVMSCMEPVVDGLIISVIDPEIKEFRASVIEGLMLNHPHDCPVCDEGGECHLQDMTVMTGHNYRRYNYKKRTYQNQNLGPFIKHEMNRCIQCYRCVRFYKDYAGGKDLNVYGSANHLYFGRHEEGTLESEFSGNLVEICPTGVFTDKVLHKSFTRKWDLTNAPSVCVHCSLGCNTIVSERYGSIKRIMNRYNSEVNGYLLCDRGRFGYEFVNDKNRLKTAQVRYSKKSELIDKGDEAILSVITCALEDNKVAAIGSARASLESNFALMTLFGVENFYHGISALEQTMVKTIIGIYKNSSIHSPSLKEIEKADAVFILGEDVTNTAPMLALALRQASRTTTIDIAAKIGIPPWNDKGVRQLAQDTKSPFFIASSYTTKLDELAENVYHASAENIAKLGFAVASLINKEASTVNDLDKPVFELAQKIAKALQEAKNPIIVSGTHSNNLELIKAAGNICLALTSQGKKANLSFSLSDCNSMGLGLMDGGSLDEVIELIKTDRVKTLIILENDLYRKTDKNLLSCISEKCPQVIVLDHSINDTTLKADIIFPVTTFAESQGTMVNNEGRAQRYYPVFPPKPNIKESWQWLRDMMQLFTKKEGTTWQNFDDVLASMCDAIPIFSKIRQLPNANFRMYNQKIARQTHRFSGRTSMNANIVVSEQKPAQDSEAPFTFSMEGFKGITPANLVPYYWSPGWNSVQATNKYLDEPAGSNIAGNAGISLFDDHDGLKMKFFQPISPSSAFNADEWLIIPTHQIFGSEELSSKGSAISERVPFPFMIINPIEFEKMGINKTDTYNVKLNGQSVQLKIKTNSGLPMGIAGISTHFLGMPYLDLPMKGTLEISSINDKLTMTT